MQSGAFLLGPVLGAAMYASLPLWIILLSDLAGALVASATVALVKIPDPERKTQQIPHFFHEMKEGAAAIWQDKKLFIVTAATLLGMVFYAPLSTYYPLMTSDYFKADAWHASMVNFGYAGGMMLCAIILGKFGTIRNKFPVIHLGLLGMEHPRCSAVYCLQRCSGFGYLQHYAHYLGQAATCIISPISPICRKPSRLNEWGVPFP